MRDLTPTLLAACGAPGSVPALRLELADIWPHFATVATPGDTGPGAAAIAPDGSIVAAFISPAGALFARRVSTPADAAQWAPHTAISADARVQAGCCVCVAGATVRLLWQANSTTAIWCADSADNGQSWGAPAALFDPGHPCYGIDADSDLSTVLIAYDATGLSAIRLAAWRLAGSWSGSDWTNGDQTTIVGLATVRAGSGYAVALALQGATGEAYSIQGCVYTPGAMPAWSALSPIAAVDIGAGVSVFAPHLAWFDGAYRLSFAVADSGAVSGLIYARTARTSSADFAQWQAPLEDSEPFPNGAAWLRHATGDMLVAAEAVRFAPAYDAAHNYRDLTADVLRLDLVEREGEPARLVATLDNGDDAYTTLAALLPNAQLLLSQGFVGAGLVPTHLLYVDEWTFARAADTAQVTLVASDRLRFLGRQTRAPLLYAGRTLGFMVTDLAIRGGFDAAQVDSSAQFAEEVDSFQVPAGESYLPALARLLAAYDGAALVRIAPGAGPAFPVVESLWVVGKRADQAPVWTYSTEPAALRLTRSGDRANHVVVYGPQRTSTALAEAWDWADVGATGQERFALVVEGFAGDAAAAQLAATLALAREQRLATRLTLTAAPHPGLELLDAVGVMDPRLGSVTARLIARRLTYFPLDTIYEQVLLCEGM